MNAYRGFPIIVRIKDFYNPFLFLKGVGDFLKIYETGWGWESIVD